MVPEREALTWRDLRLAAWTLPARTVVALTLWAEARGQGVTGLAAVAWVIKRRVERRRLNYQHACLDPWQFSCWNATEDANTRALGRMTHAVLAAQPIDDPSWPTCLRIADGVIAGVLPDPVFGADHYLTTALFQSAKCPGWAKDLTVASVVGAHTFLKERAT